MTDVLIVVYGESESIVGLIGKLLWRKLISQTTILFTEWLQTRPVVLLNKVLQINRYINKKFTYSMSFHRFIRILVDQFRNKNRFLRFTACVFTSLQVREGSNELKTNLVYLVST